jgi:myo-inositol-1(or 4)-monophosphatase
LSIAAPHVSQGRPGHDIPTGLIGPHDMNLHRIRQQLTDLLRQGAGLAAGEVSVIRTDANPQTDLDTRADQYLRSQLVRIVDAPIMSEEDEIPSTGRGGQCWVLDPIDGTINAIAGTDEFAMSVALVDTDSLEPLVGAVYQPRPAVIYQAAAGHGGYRDEQRLPAAGRSPEGIRIVSFGVPKDIPGIAPRMSEAFHRMLARGWVTRQTGSASIDICRVAAGSWSAFFEFGLMYWDFVAAFLIAREAGCHTLMMPSDPDAAGPMPLEYDVVVARTEEILAEIADATGIQRTPAVP